MTATRAPIQFNFAENWHFKVLPHRHVGDIHDGFLHLREIYEEIAHWAFDEIDPSYLVTEDMIALAKEKLDLELHTARVSCFDLYWIQETFESDQIVPLSLAIAQELYPHMRWEIVGDGTEVAVVSDLDRTIVFDLKNFRKLSGAASLALAGDPRFQKEQFGMAEALQFREEKLQKELESLKALQNLVQEDDDQRKLSLVSKLSSDE